MTKTNLEKFRVRIRRPDGTTGYMVHDQFDESSPVIEVPHDEAERLASVRNAHWGPSGFRYVIEPAEAGEQVVGASAGDSNAGGPQLARRPAVLALAERLDCDATTLDTMARGDASPSEAEALQEAATALKLAVHHLGRVYNGRAV